MCQVFNTIRTMRMVHSEIELVLWYFNGRFFPSLQSQDVLFFLFPNSSVWIINAGKNRANRYETVTNIQRSWLVDGYDDCHWMIRATSGVIAPCPFFFRISRSVKSILGWWQRVSLKKGVSNSHLELQNWVNFSIIYICTCWGLPGPK